MCDTGSWYRIYYLHPTKLVPLNWYLISLFSFRSPLNAVNWLKSQTRLLGRLPPAAFWLYAIVCTYVRIFWRRTTVSSMVSWLSRYRFNRRKYLPENWFRLRERISFLGIVCHRSFTRYDACKREKRADEESCKRDPREKIPTTPMASAR